MDGTMEQTSSGLRFGTVRLATGPRLHYVEQGDLDGEPILFLHGWPDSWFSFSRVLQLLPRRYRAFAIDQRGFGDSERPECGYGIDELAADAVAFLDAVGVERATVVGHSMGSFVARRVAVANPDRVARLVLIGSGVSALNPVTSAVQEELSKLPDPIPMEFIRSFQAGTAYIPLPQAFFAGIVAESAKLPTRLWRATFARLLAYDDVEQLGRITVPTLLLWGDRDELFSQQDQDGLLAMMPNARLKVYPKTGHCPNWERPDLVVADLDALVQET